VERCSSAWRKKDPIYLHYRNDWGWKKKALIWRPARWKTPKVRCCCCGPAISRDLEVEIDIDYGDDEDDEEISKTLEMSSHGFRAQRELPPAPVSGRVFSCARSNYNFLKIYNQPKRKNGQKNCWQCWHWSFSR
jgi:hypothetical protein